MNLQKTSNEANGLTAVLLIIYSIALCWILLFKLGVEFSYMANRKVNLVPFNEVLASTGRIDVSQVILNIVIFIPLGIYAGVLFERRNFGRKLFFFFLVSLFFESFQFILSIGAFDATDIVTNTSGGIIGFMIYKAIEKAFDSPVRAQKFINVIAGVGTILMIVLLLLLKMDMLPVRYR